MLFVSLVGSTRVFDLNGQDFTPRSKKARGLLALLLLSKDQRRARAWLQKKLWSDRGLEQGAASLRQTLTELRRALGPHKDVLITESGWVQLDPSGVTLEKEGATEADDAELCEDLDIRDPEFESWLRTRRLGETEQSILLPPLRTLPVLVIDYESDAEADQTWIVQSLKSNIVRSLLEFSEVRIFDLQSGGDTLPKLPGPGIVLRVSTSARGSAVAVSLKIETLSGNWMMWHSPIEIIQNTPLEDEEMWRLNSLAQMCTARIQDEFERQSETMSAPRFALGLANRAIRTLYSFKKEDLVAGDKLLKAAYEIDPRGVYLSWRAFIRNTAVFEHLSDDFLEPLESFDLHATALSDDAFNSYALVFAAQHSFVNDGDPMFGLTLCDKALEVNPGNPLGWAFRANMLVQQGKPEQAMKATERGLQLAKGMPCYATLAINGVMAHTAAGEYEAAIAHGRFNQLTRTKCQAIRRFMFVLYKILDKPSQAEEQLGLIRRREKTFEPEHLLRPNYPTWTLQRLPIADALNNSD